MYCVVDSFFQCSCVDGKGDVSEFYRPVEFADNLRGGRWCGFGFCLLYYEEEEDDESIELSSRTASWLGWSHVLDSRAVVFVVLWLVTRMESSCRLRVDLACCGFCTSMTRQVGQKFLGGVSSMAMSVSPTLGAAFGWSESFWRTFWK